MAPNPKTKLRQTTSLLAHFFIAVPSVIPSEHEVFTEALSFTEAAARAEYLDRVCGNDVVKRQRLNELLKLHERADSILDRHPQEMIESLSDSVDPADPTLQSSRITLAALQPFLEPAAQADSLGRLCHYELLEVLGQGGYGIVFKAFDTKLSRMVAIKILSPHLATTSPPRRRFLREARAAAAVRHEHVVQIYAVEESPIPYLVMEFVAGETLQQRSDRMGPFEPAEVVRLGQQIARGLAAAHEQGLIHRDIKPCNILIADGIETTAKLSDFGLARTVDDASISQSGIVIGTPMYMSPEQVAGEEVDQRTDLFSFGSVLYLMACGRPPFRASSTLAVLKRVAEDRPRSIRDVIADVPDGLCRLIARLHSKSREERFLTAREVESALATCLLEPNPTFQRRIQQFLATRPGRLWGAAVVLLIAGLIGVVIGESTGQTHLFQPNIQRDPAPTVAAQANIPSVDVAGPQTAVPAPVAAPTSKADQLEVKSTEKTIEKPVVASTASPVETVALTDWEKAVGMMSPEDQEMTVRAKFKQLNPNMDVATIHFEGDDGVIRHMRIENVDELLDISPIRALRKITYLKIVGRGVFPDLEPLRGLPLESLEIVGPQIHDLTPLKNMPLTHLGLWPFMGDDLTPLRGMKLKTGNLGGGTRLRDIEPLRGMPIEGFCFNHTEVADLTPLKDCPLKRLEIQNTKVTDLSQLVGLKLEFLAAAQTSVADLSPLKSVPTLTGLTISYDAARDKAVLQAMPNLQTVNGKPLAEFLANP